jgi:methylthioribose-1-phosphate isomerase
MADVAKEVSNIAQHLFDDDLATCKAIGENGARLAAGKRLRVLTHCNTGSLATAGYGTALGVIRSLAQRGQIEIVYADETRPYLQGSRLTAFELKSEGIEHKVIADSAAAYLMQQGKVDWVVVGADRIALNGDTANKIGTYSLAVNCKHHGVEFLPQIGIFDGLLGCSTPAPRFPASKPLGYPFLDILRVCIKLNHTGLL